MPDMRVMSCVLSLRLRLSLTNLYRRQSLIDTHSKQVSLRKTYQRRLTEADPVLDIKEVDGV